MLKDNEAEAKSDSPPDYFVLSENETFNNPHKGYNYTPWLSKALGGKVKWTKDRPNRPEPVSIMLIYNWYSLKSCHNRK